MDTESARRTFERYDGRGGISVRVTSPLLEKNLLAVIAPPTAIFHFHGHGQGGYLILEGDDRARKPVFLEVEKVAHAFTNSSLGLVVLNSCNGTHRLEENALSTADALLRAGVPAVVAMQGEIYDDAANDFAEALYLGIATGVPVDLAVQRARLQLFTAPSGDSADWFLPVFYEQVSTPFRLADSSTSEHRHRVEAGYGAVSRRLLAAAPRLAIYGKLSATHIRAFPKGSSVVHLLDAVAPRVSQRLAETQQDKKESLSGSDIPDDLLLAELQEAAAEEPPAPEIAEGVGALRELVGIVRAQLSTGGERERAPAANERLTAVDRGMRLPRSHVRTDGDEPLALPAGHTLDQVVTSVCHGLVLDRGMVRRALLHLLAGRHLILSGPPGTGKTTLAQRLADALGYELKISTANPDWTTFDLLGGLFPKGVRGSDGRVELTYDIRPGHLVEATLRNWSWEGEIWRRQIRAGEAGKGCWLLIDELNRAPMDRAFGELFTALETSKLVVPVIPDDEEPHATTGIVPIPKDFRLIGTINTFDKRLLFELSDALKRRFAFVNVGLHIAADLTEVKTRLLFQVRRRAAVSGLGIDVEGIFDRAYEMIAPAMKRIRLLRELGVAQVVDVLCYCLVASAFDEIDLETAVDQAMTDQILPQLEGMNAFELDLLAALLQGRGLAREVAALLKPSVDGFSSDPARVRAARIVVRHVVEELGLDGPWRALHSTLSAGGVSSGATLDDLLEQLSNTGPDPSGAGVSGFSDGLRATARERADS